MLRFAVLFALLGCSTTLKAALPLTRRDVASINEEVDGKPASIQLRNEPCCRAGENVAVSANAVEWTDESKPPRRVRAPPEAVERITLRYHGHGALAGAAVGLAVGVALGALLATGINGDEAYLLRSISIWGLGITGALVFGLGGAIIGAPHHIDLTSPPP